MTGMQPPMRCLPLRLFLSQVALTSLVTACVSARSGVPDAESTVPPARIASREVTARVPPPSSLPSSVPSLSPESARPVLQLTYVAERGPRAFGLFAVGIGCTHQDLPCVGEPQLLFEGQRWLSAGSRVFSWSPDGQRLAFDGPGLANRFDVFVSDWDGANQINITHSPVDEMFPAWSPDGTSIAYVLYTRRGSLLFWSNEDGSDGGELLTDAYTDSPGPPDWSLDGAYLTFTDIADWGTGIDQVFISNARGSRLMQVTNSDQKSYTPEFCGNGFTIVFSRDVFDPTAYGGASDQNLFLADTDPAGELWLAGERGANYSEPTCSPSGDWIAFSLHRYPDSYDIFLIRPDGSGLTNVTNTPQVMEWWPEWRLLSVP